MEQWSALSNVINYVKYNRNPTDCYKLHVMALEPKNHKRLYKKLEKNDRQVIDSDFGDASEKLKE